MLAASKKFLKVPHKGILANARTRKALKTGGLAVLGALLFLGLAFFAFRNAVLRSVLERKIRSYEKGHIGARVEVGSARFNGLAGIDLESIRMRSAAGTLDVSLSRCSVRVSFWKMLSGRVQLKRLALNDLRIYLRQGAAASPPSAGAPAGDKTGSLTPNPAPDRAPDFGARAAQLLDLYFTRIPDSLEIDRLTIHSAFDDIHQALYIPRLAIQGPVFDTALEVYDQGEKWVCLLDGKIERHKRRLELRLRPREDKRLASLPFVNRQLGLKVSFDSLAVGLHSRGRKGGVLRLEGSLAVRGLALNHRRIAAGDVNLPNAALDYVLNIGTDFFELDNRSRVNFARIRFHPYLKFQNRPTRHLELKISPTRFAADDLFASLPAGLFTRLAGIRTRGELAFHLGFSIDLARPEELSLAVELEKHNFKIKRFGRVDFREVNAPFLYTTYEKDQAMRSFMVGRENPDFRELGQIPPFLINSVLISEDGAFFGHRGFLLEPFKNSIVANLKAGRFVRGASTISMQLVKNLYLNRQKTIARKLEEMLITWLIEENRLVDKERMLEIYLNIIEWGPGVNGAQEAARYYFAKDIADLTLAETVFMASIIPRPQRFKYFFDENQRLRPWLQAYFRDVSAKMLARGWISQADHDSLLPEVTLTGPARLLLNGAEAEVEEENWNREVEG